MVFEMDRTRLAVIGVASVVLVGSIIGLVAFGDNDADETSSQTTAAASITSLTENADEVELPTTSGAEAAATTATASASSTPTTAQVTSAPTSPASEAAAATTPGTAAAITSSSVATAEKRGCPDGLVLVGSNGTEPICQQAGAGCPDGYAVIGGVNGALLCKGSAGDVLRVQPDGTVTIDTSVPFNGPLCQQTDAAGNVIELTLALNEQDCLGRGGEFFPNGQG